MSIEECGICKQPKGSCAPGTRWPDGDLCAWSDAPLRAADQHSCHDDCPRTPCVLGRRVRELEAKCERLRGALTRISGNCSMAESTQTFYRPPCAERMASSRRDAGLPMCPRCCARQALRGEE